MQNDSHLRHWSLSRRVFLGGTTTVLAGGALRFTPVGGLAVSTLGTVRTPVISFTLDRPYLDHSGTGAPYHGPPGALAGQPLAEASEDDLARRFPYF